MDAGRLWETYLACGCCEMEAARLRVCWKLSLHMGGTKWMLEGDVFGGNIPYIWEV